MVVPPIQRGAVPVAWRGEREERRVVCSRGGEHAHTQREREGESGGVSGRALVGLAGGGAGGDSPFSGCVGDAGGRGASPLLVVGLGWW